AVSPGPRFSLHSCSAMRSRRAPLKPAHLVMQSEHKAALAARHLELEDGFAKPTFERLNLWPRCFKSGHVNLAQVCGENNPEQSMQAPFHLIDLVSQCTAVERLLAGMSDAQKIDWLSAHGRLALVPTRQGERVFHFTSTVGLEACFFLHNGLF